MSVQAKIRKKGLSFFDVLIFQIPFGRDDRRSAPQNSAMPLGRISRGHHVDRRAAGRGPPEAGDQAWWNPRQFPTL